MPTQTIEMLDNWQQRKHAQEPAQDPSHLARTAIAGANSYYRSSLLTVSQSVNHLTAAAESLLSLNQYLKTLQQMPDCLQLHQKLVHEIHAFETQAQSQGYRAETILIGRYALCAMLDETIEQSQIEGAEGWQNYRLLNAFQNEECAEERFFFILERISEEVNFHLDVLELIYLVLSLGYQGKFRNQSHGSMHLDKIKDGIYQKLKHHRPEPRLLLGEPPLASTDKTEQKKPKKLRFFMFKTLLLTLLCMLTIYLGFAYLFNEVTFPMQQQLQYMTQQAEQQASPSTDTL
jgi:type VI secretion system protein ImpK